MFRMKPRVALILTFALLEVTTHAPFATASELLPIWPGLAPGESTSETGTQLPPRDQGENPVVRITGITSPTMEVFLPTGESSGAAVLILPGGAYKYVVTNKEGSEIAERLNQHGIAAFVLKYRTRNNEAGPHWRRPLADAQRALRVIRSRASEWSLDPTKLGIAGFSAGGQTAAIHVTHPEDAYKPVDKIDQQSAKADFALLIYPWNLYDENTDRLIDLVRPDKQTPPTFLVHTHDDQSSSLGSVHFYAELKKHDVPAELHVYTTGGHGYGTREQPSSVVHTWMDRAIEWLRLRGLTIDSSP